MRKGLADGQVKGRIRQTVRIAGNQKDGGAAIQFLDGRGQILTAHARHNQIGQDDVERLLGMKSESEETIVSGLHLVAIPPETRGNDRANARIVIDHENPQRPADPAIGRPKRRLFCAFKVFVRMHLAEIHMHTECHAPIRRQAR